MKIVLNPKYYYLEDVIRKLPLGDYQSEHVYRNRRNTVEKITVDGMPLVVKRFKKPYFPNRIIYSFFRRSKARRSYEYSEKLTGLGIETAEPIAYIEIKKNGLLHTGYYVASYVPHILMNNLDGYDEETQAEVLKAFTHFTVEMHSKGVYHKDYSRGNVFFYERNGDYKFVLIDVNRMKFKTPSMRKSSKNLIMLHFPIPVLAEIMDDYACQRGWDPYIFCGAVLLKKGVNVRRRLKYMVKGILQIR